MRWRSTGTRSTRSTSSWRTPFPTDGRRSPYGGGSRSLRERAGRRSLFFVSNEAMFTLALALALLAPRDTLRSRPAAQEGPAVVVVHHQPAIPVVALRLSLLADDPEGYAGAGHLLQH